MAYEPERATLEDLDAIIEVVDQCFPYDRERGGMLARWPHCYLRNPETVGNLLVIRDHGRPVSVVEYVDQAVKVGDDWIRVGGVTAVATLPSYRRRGFMSRLLSQCIRYMQEERYALSELGGLRLRYNHFGWENGGLEWRFEIGRECLHRRPRDGRYHVVSYDAQPEELEGIFSIHSGERVGLERSAELTAILLRRGGYETWLAKGPDGVAAYAVCYADEDGGRSVAEFGGDPEGLHVILCHLVDGVGASGLSVNSPRLHPLNGYLTSVSWRWGLGIRRMIKIIDLERTLRGFRGQLLERCQQLDLREERSVVLGIEGTGRQVQVNYSRDAVSMSPSTRGSPIVELPELSMVRFLFCPPVTDVAAEAAPGVRVFQGLLPLDFFIWPLERV